MVGKTLVMGSTLSEIKQGFYILNRLTLMKRRLELGSCKNLVYNLAVVVDFSNVQCYDENHFHSFTFANL